MNRYSKKHWTLRRKIVVLVAFVCFLRALISISGVILHPLWGGGLQTDIAATPADLNNRIKRYVDAHLPHGSKIPGSATEIYVYISPGLNGSFYLSMTLPDEDLIKFAEEFSEVTLVQFKDGCASGVDSIDQGPPRPKIGWKAYYWNMTDVSDGKHDFYHGQFIGVDLDSNRVYVYCSC